ncbi:MAG: glycosyltransferase family 2 protein [Ruminococcaceae bacterium]|nr:glycosyltransferase family 2 protein [Oscillospiraceae bacterium]
MKKVSIMVPCYNEEENVVPMSRALVEQMEQLPQYDYEILFIDNCSQDNTRTLLRGICAENPKIRAIFNSKNFGQFNSPYHAICQTTGDCTITVCCDFQDPVDMIPKFLTEWENGHKVVIGVKTSSKESKLMYFLRSIYYKLIHKLSRVEQIEHFTGFGLYDKSFVEVMRKLDDPIPFLRGVVAELGPNIKRIEYEQAKRRAGKTSNNFFSLYDAAMLSFTSYTKIGVRLSELLGVLMCGGSALAAVVCLILKLVNPDLLLTGTAAILLTVLFVGGLQLFFLGFVGEYLLSVNTRSMRRPLVVEEERINFDSADKTSKV